MMGSQVNCEKKKTVWNYIVWLFFAYLLFSGSVTVRAEEAVQEVTLYDMTSSYYEKITMPSSYKNSYQWNVGDGGTVTYSVKSGSSVTVSSTGLITPKYTYWKGGLGSSSWGDQEYDYYTISAGDTTLTAKCGSQIYELTVHLIDYSTIYCNAVMDQYIDDNYTDGMTDLDLMKMIAKFPAGYDYSPYYSGANAMIIHGGGDCWASTSAIIKLSERLSINKGLDIIAWSRNGNRDAGGGSGHMNAMTEFNSKYYELEAGYSSSKGSDGYRPYHVNERTSLFSYRNYSSYVAIYQYDGRDKTGELIVPDMIDGKPVTVIESKTFSGNDFSKIVLPDTVTTIGSSAFNSCDQLVEFTIPNKVTSIGDFAFCDCDSLTEIRIPVSVTSIGNAVFCGCDKLSSIQIAEDNPGYFVEDDVIYSKDGTVLVECPYAANVTIPSSVKKIDVYAFYYNDNIASITIPGNVTTLEKGAFAYCSKLSDVEIDGEGLVTVGEACFYNDKALSVMRFPASLEELGAYSFRYCSALKYVYFRGDAPTFGGTVDGSFCDRVFNGCTLSAYYPQGNNTWNEDVLTDHDGTIEWNEWSVVQPISISEASITLSENSFTYTGSSITPEITVTLNGKELVKDEDYTITYRNNQDAGRATISVEGIGSYDGKTETSFVIDKAPRTARAYSSKSRIVENEFTDIYYVSLKGNYSYTSDDTSVATVDENGVITGVNAGTTTIAVTVEETPNYLPATVDLTITVTHDTSMEVLDETVTDGKIKAICPQCNSVVEQTVPTSFTVYWYEEGSYSGSTAYKKERNIGEKLECSCSTSSVDLKEMEIISMNERVITITDGCYLNFIADGTAQVIVRPKYNPAIARIYTFIVGTGTESDEHTYEAEVIQNADCTKPEITRYTCSDCGDFYDVTTKAAIGHNYSFENLVQEGNCEQDEKTEYTCESCGFSRTLITKKASGHCYDRKLRKKAVCTEPEYVKYSCKCGASYTEIAREPMEHCYKEETLQEGNCVEPRIVKYSCVNCGMTHQEEEAVPGHRYDNGVVTKQPTTQETGIKTYTCSVCGNTKQEVIDKLSGETEDNPQDDPSGGTEDNPTDTTEETEKEKPTDTTEETEKEKPTDTTEETEKEKPTGTTEETEKEKPTGTTEETEKEKPTDTTEETEKEKPTGTTEEAEKEKPTGMTEGTEKNKPSGVTGETEKDKPSNPTTETGKDESVDIVGSIITVKDVKYEITSGNTVSFVGNDKTGEAVVIPSKVNGYKVTSICANAFKDNKKLKKVTVSSNITSIGANAFSGCKNLKTITIKSAKIKKFGKNALKGIKKNAIIKVPRSKYKEYKKLLNSKAGFKKTMKLKKA